MASAASRSKEQLKEFMQFFDTKRELYVSEVDATIKDVKEARLFDDMYSKDDVEDMFRDLQSSVTARVGRDLDSIIAMAALVLEQVFHNAEDAGVPLAIDTSRSEDASSLRRMADLKGGLSLDSDMRRKGGVKLDSLRDEHARLVGENARLGEEAKALRERVHALSGEASSTAREKAEAVARCTALAAEVEALKSGASAGAASSASHAAEVASLAARLAAATGEVEKLKTEVLTAAREREVSINASKPFLQLKALLQKKNAALAETRARLAKYEPDAAGEATED